MSCLFLVGCVCQQSLDQCVNEQGLWQWWCNDFVEQVSPVKCVETCTTTLFFSEGCREMHSIIFLIFLFNLTCWMDGRRNKRKKWMKWKHYKVITFYITSKEWKKTEKSVKTAMSPNRQVKSCIHQIHEHHHQHYITRLFQWRKNYAHIYTLFFW